MGRDNGEDRYHDLAKAASQARHGPRLGDTGQSAVQRLAVMRGHREESAKKKQGSVNSGCWGAGITCQQVYCVVSSVMAVWVGSSRLHDSCSGCSLTSKHEAYSALMQKEN